MLKDYKLCKYKVVVLLTVFMLKVIIRFILFRLEKKEDSEEKIIINKQDISTETKGENGWLCIVINISCG